MVRFIMRLKQPAPLTVTLASPEAEIVRRAVSEGGYASSVDVLQDALHHWQNARLEDAGQLKAAYDEGMASGEGRAIDRAEFVAGLKAGRLGRGWLSSDAPRRRRSHQHLDLYSSP